MTEAEWLASEDPRSMLEFAAQRDVATRDYCIERISDRKLRLFGIACAMKSGATRISASDAAIVRKNDIAAWATEWCGNGRHAHNSKITQATKANLLREIVGNPWRLVGRWVEVGEDDGWGVTDHETVPWLTSTVLSIAQAAYEETEEDGILDPVRLTILAEALEEAGCDTEDILRHLRGEERGYGRLSDFWYWVPLRGPHVRGCWALDLIRGKE